MHTKVSSMISNEGWNWPRRLNGVMAGIVNQIPANEMLDCSKDDHLRWTPSSDGIFFYKISLAYC